MSTSFRQFNTELYQEHLEDASFLYEQQLAYRDDPEINWPDLGSWQERFEAHIDALALGGELALEICRQQAAAGDAGEMHAALRVFCRHDRKADAFTVLRALDPDDHDALGAAAHALRCDAPRDWRDDLLQLLQDNQANLTTVLARVAGYRRFACEDMLKSALIRRPASGSAEVAWALGRVGSEAAVPALWSLLDSEDGRVCEAAAIALMRLGDDRPVQRATIVADAHSWARHVLAIGGNSRSARILLKALEGKQDDAGTVLGLGMLGDLSAVVPLLDLLENEALAEPAAVALNTITGAALFADVFVPDIVDPDELSARERDAYDKDGTLPLHGGRPYGNWERRALLDKPAWRAWLDQNKHRFNRDQRWRLGKPYGPTALFECLSAPTTPFAVRSATYEELVIRYGLEVPFEAELPVRQQMQFLTRIEEWLAANAGAFVDGRWYFAGRIQG